MNNARSLISIGFASIFALVIGLAGLVQPAAVSAATAMPKHVFSPYFQTYTSDIISTVAHQSGARYFSLAFLESLGTSSCKLAWDGDSSRQVGSGAYASDIATLRRMGGDVTPSLGGYSADHDGTEIADSCTDVNKIAAAYEGVITTYNVSRLDMDVEDNSLSNSAGISRRNKAIKIVQGWASAHHRPLQISFTLPTSRSGLDPDGLAVLQDAVSNGVRIDIVQPMVFDYYDGKSTDMGSSAISVLKGLHSQLATLLPSKTSAQLWAMEGATIMNGRDDHPGASETTTVADAKQLLKFAKSKGLAVLSMWAIQRDNGGCPGTSGADDCSGISQSTWAFTKALKGF